MLKSTTVNQHKLGAFLKMFSYVPFHLKVFTTHMTYIYVTIHVEKIHLRQ